MNSESFVQQGSNLIFWSIIVILLTIPLILMAKEIFDGVEKVEFPNESPKKPESEKKPNHRSIHDDWLTPW